MQTIPYVGYSLYQLFLIFCFWSFIGWCIEVIDMTYETGEYQNRGFLNMPICPIEGLGVIMVVVFFRSIKDTIIPLFLASTVLCTAFELFVGWGMEKLFHARWWDYSHMKFNFKGYICLRNSLFFGFGCVVCVRYVQPLVESTIAAIPLNVGKVIVWVMAVLIAVDTVVSLLAVKKLSDKIKRVDEISKLMLAGSVKVGMKLASGTLKVKSGVDKIIDVKDNAAEKVKSGVDKIIDVKDNAAEKVKSGVDKIIDVKDNAAERVKDISAANMEKLKSEYERLISERDAATERLLRAFPRMQSKKYAAALQAIKEKLHIKTDFSGDKKAVCDKEDAPETEET